MDAATASAVAAVAVAAVAFFVALAQVLQQYFVTGSLLRLCDDTVYGMLPGRGRRVWKSNQFRFRVIYTLPQIRLEQHFWPNEYHEEHRLYSFPFLGTVHNAPPPPSWAQYRPTRLRGINKLLSNLGRQISRRSRYIIWVPRKILRTFRRAFRYSTRLSSSRRREGNCIEEDRAMHMRSPLQRTVGRQGVSSIRKIASRNFRRHPFEPTGKHSGEASWASFARIVQYSCDSSLRFAIVEGDADRCPSDLSVVPMQVSLRDIIVMGIMAGMTVSRANIKYNTLSMAGCAGSITSSRHPILGSIIHFNPTNVNTRFGWRIRHGRINQLWVRRMEDEVPIANQSYTWRDRARIVAYDGEWTRADSHALRKHSGRYSPSRPKTGATTYAFTGGNLSSPTEHFNAPSLNQSTDVIPLSENAVDKRFNGVHDGVWSLTLASGNPVASSMIEPINDQTHVIIENNEGQDADGALPKSSYFTRLKGWLTKVRSLSSSKRLRIIEDHIPTVPVRPAEVSDYTPDIAADGDGSARDLPRPSLPFFVGGVSQIQPNSSDTDNSPHRHESSSWSPKIPSPSLSVVGPSVLQHSVRVDQPEVYGEGEILDGTSGRTSIKAHQPFVSEEVDGEEIVQIADRGNVGVADPEFGIIDPTRIQSHSSGNRQLVRYITEFGEPAISSSEPEEPRMKSQKQRDSKRSQRYRSRRRERSPSERRGAFTWRWASQMNVTPGYCATPWSDGTKIQAAIAQISVVLEALSARFDKKLLFYVPDDRLWEPALNWAREGHSTWPSYAVNARGGVVVDGDYIGAKLPGFARPIARIELFQDYSFQSNQSPLRGDLWDQIRLAELMMLDSWLSICGRAPEIVDGKSSLLRNMPALIEHVMLEFYEDFKSIDRSANEGGFQLIQDVARDLMDFLADEGLSQAEQLFTLGALLRTCKMDVCIILGPDTIEVMDILSRDIRVWLV